jgi:AhpD family alkylhydroperoxidase
MTDHQQGVATMTAHQQDPARNAGQTAFVRTTQECTMNARLDLFGNPVAARFSRYIVSAGKVLADSALPAPTQELVKIRASQINGCGFCVDMHTKDAAHAGEASARLSLVAAWREATVFTEAERAALELAEQGTRIADAAGGVTDEAWADAAKHYDEDQLAALVCAIAYINAFNRGFVMAQQPAGDYQPGQFG